MEGTPLAKCPLKDASDDRNYLYLTDKKFIVKINGKLYDYDIEAVNFLYWKNRKLLFPIIVGGLLTTLSLLAYFNGILHPWLLLLLFICGIFLLYYGFDGTPALVLNMGKSNDQYLLRSTSIYLESFIKFFNNYVQTNQLPQYYLQISKKTWEEAQEMGSITLKKPHKLYENPVLEHAEKVNLKILLEQQEVSIHYITSETNNTLIPCVTGSMPLKAVIKI